MGGRRGAVPWSCWGGEGTGLGCDVAQRGCLRWVSLGTAPPTPPPPRDSRCCPPPCSPICLWGGPSPAAGMCGLSPISRRQPPRLCPPGHPPLRPTAATCETGGVTTVSPLPHSSPHFHGDAAAVRRSEGRQQCHLDLHGVWEPQAHRHLAERGRTFGCQWQVPGRWAVGATMGGSRAPCRRGWYRWDRDGGSSTVPGASCAFSALLLAEMSIPPPHHPSLLSSSL